MNTDIQHYNAELLPDEKAIADLLAQEIDKHLPMQKIKFGMGIQYGF